MTTSNKLLPVFGVLLLLLGINLPSAFSQISALLEVSPQEQSLDKLLFLGRTSVDRVPDKARRLYLEETWQKGLALDLEDNVYEVKLRYRLFDDEIQMLLRDQTYAVFPQSVKALQINKRVFVPIAFIDREDRESFGYFELLAEGYLTLLKRYELKGNKVKETLFLMPKGDQAFPLKKNKRTLLRYMSDKQQQIESFCDAHAVKWSDQEHLVRVVQFYNQLLEE